MYPTQAIDIFSVKLLRSKLQIMLVPYIKLHISQTFVGVPTKVQISFFYISYWRLKFNICIPALGAAYGTAKSGTGIAAMSVMRPELIMKSIIPVVMAGIIAIYGLVVAVLIAGSLETGYQLFK